MAYWSTWDAPAVPKVHAAATAAGSTTLGGASSAFATVLQIMNWAQGALTWSPSAV
jgi:hypothetical protein